ncbi:helix-turn-helix domain-containing protein, partial [Actinomadura geliboluensis]|uniref:helix-turn-helix domain-containing protein n=2 Tax=Thermomonosporaceae TaxID=2012 RepID=UPI0033ACDD9A
MDAPAGVLHPTHRLARARAPHRLTHCLLQDQGTRALGLTQTQLAERAGLTQPALSRLDDQLGAVAGAGALAVTTLA